MSDIKRVSFDIGEVISKFPDIFRPIITALQASEFLEIFVLTDMHDPEETLEMLTNNRFIEKRQKTLLTRDGDEWRLGIKRPIY